MPPLRPRFALPVRPLICLLLLGVTLGSLSLLASAAAAPASPRDAVAAAARAGLARLADYFHTNMIPGTNPACSPSPGATNCVAALTVQQNAGVLVAIQAVLPDNVEAFYVDSTGARFGTDSIGAPVSVPFATGAGNDGVAGVQVRSTAGGIPGPFTTYTLVSVSTILHPPSDPWWYGTPTPLPQGAHRNQDPVTYPGHLLIWPIVLFTSTIAVNDTVTFDSHTGGYASGTWGWACLTNNTSPFDLLVCSQANISDWMHNGFDPATGVRVWGELMRDPNRGPGAAVLYNSLPVGWDGTNADSTGFWTWGRTDTVPDDLAAVMQQAAAERWRVFLPIADRNDDYRLYAYHITDFAG
ncbi:MAG TPA: hypothetical protein VFM49_28815, partial [Chloroflexia bacterium]|nr:hypothetical protein [Chloroflexia bacterium]